ncbi:MAG: 30S ribosomal protein S8e [Thermoplasmatota archaeon]
MALWQGGSRRKNTGGRLIKARGKRRSEIARERLETNIAPHAQKLVRAKAGAQKIKLLRTDRINVTDTKSGKTTPAQLTNVVENPANIHYVRRNIITKGAIVETSAGKARVTSRPGQHGVLSGVLVE